MSSLLNKTKNYQKFEDDDVETAKKKVETDKKASDAATSSEDTVMTVQYKKLEDDVTNENIPSKETDENVFPVLVIPQEDTAYVNVNFHLGESTSATSGGTTLQVPETGTAQTEVKTEEPKLSHVSVITEVKKTKSRHPPMAKPPPDFLGCSIFVTIFCCPALGAFAIHQSMQCRRAAKRGHRAKAIWASQTAWKVARVAFLVGILVQVVIIFALVEAFA
ncbi:uncharacterized protein [Ptychodera flava]|uniref:uncharacterized protein n=1 Tax=Ptychodera flava TaxID=63121 RepID=UPI003969E61A